MLGILEETEEKQQSKKQMMKRKKKEEQEEEEIEEKNDNITIKRPTTGPTAERFSGSLQTPAKECWAAWELKKGRVHPSSMAAYTGLWRHWRVESEMKSL